MFTNTKVITVFHKSTDVEKCFPTWEKHLFYDVYWENCSGQSEESKGIGESNEMELQTQAKRHKSGKNSPHSALH